jgi:hypothetical protein
VQGKGRHINILQRDDTVRGESRKKKIKQKRSRVQTRRKLIEHMKKKGKRQDKVKLR